MDVDSWGRFFESIGVRRDGPFVTVRLLGDHRNASWSDACACDRPLRSIAYDAERDVLVVSAGGTTARPALRYFISRPRRISVEESPQERRIVVDGSDRLRTAISVHAHASARTRSRAVLKRVI